MLLDLESRTVSLSVGECAGFSPLPAVGSGGFSGNWRLESGRQWHQTLGEQTQLEHPTACLEHAVEGTLEHRSWTLRLRGRMDQWIPSDAGGLIREVKTVSGRLPDDPENLWLHYPEYFYQIGLYQRLMESTELSGAITEVHAELVFLDIDDGLTQVVPLTEAHHRALRDHLHQWVDYLETRREHRMELQRLPDQKPFKRWRPGQADSSRRLKNSLHSQSVSLFEAPTGFGKTGIVLDAGVELLRSGAVDRVVFLTGKTSGQLAAVQQLQNAYGDPQSLLFYRMRNLQQHADGLLDPGRLSPEEQRERWLSAGIQPHRLFQKGTVDLETVIELARNTGVPGFEISRLLLRYAQVWIGDYNYIFHPGSNGVFTNQPDFDPSRSLLIVDEAHNLPDRVADAWSGTLSVDALQSLHAYAHQQWHHHPILRDLDRMLRWLPKMPVEQELDPPDESFVHEWIDGLVERIQSTPIPWQEVPDTIREGLWNLLSLHQLQSHPLNRSLTWKPNPGRLAISCLDPAPLLREILSPYHRSILLSATFGPLETYRKRCGLEGLSARHIPGKADWIARAYRIAIDLRVNTRYNARRASLPRICANLNALREQSGPAVVAFAPSYEFARQIAEYLRFHLPALRVIEQPRNSQSSGTSPDAFLAENLPFCDILLLIMGSPFAESIDQLGGKVHCASIISPGLPSRDFLSLQRFEADLGNERERFLRHSQIPGMIRVAQAMGRLVRDPAHRVSVLLQCERFAEASTAQLLPDYCRRAKLITDDADWEQWVADGQ
ncbi:MAG: hypothetical protein JJU20_02115 [Opitutales bacterium]|nr:hypothetical protein [Opitutales bacterium]